MNKFLKKALLSTVLLTATISNASELKSVKISEVKRLDISLSKVLKGETISITSKAGETVYSEILSQADFFSISLDFSKFDQGVYYMKSEINSTTKITPIIVVPQQLKVLQGETKVYHIPTFNETDDLLTIDVNNEGKHPTNIYIYAGSTKINIVKNSTDKLIYKSYDLTNLSIGKYTAVVTVGDFIFNKEFTR